MSRYKLDIFVVENFNIRQLDQCIQKPSHVLDRKKKKKPDHFRILNLFGRNWVRINPFVEGVPVCCPQVNPHTWHFEFPVNHVPRGFVSGGVCKMNLKYKLYCKFIRGINYVTLRSLCNVRFIIVKPLPIVSKDMEIDPTHLRTVISKRRIETH